MQLQRSVHIMASGFSGSYPAARDLLSPCPIADSHEEDDAPGPEHHDTLAARSSLARWTGEAGMRRGARDQYAALLSIRRSENRPRHFPDSRPRQPRPSPPGEEDARRGPRNPVRCRRRLVVERAHLASSTGIRYMIIRKK